MLKPLYASSSSGGYPVIEGSNDEQPELDFSHDPPAAELTEPPAPKPGARGKTADLFPKMAKEANPSAKSGLPSAVEMREKLRTGPLSGVRVGLLHARLDADDKEVIVRRFQRGEIDVLISTSVIEVSVDVPNASVMVVDHAERFGQAQLHPLRGRVGRGAAKSYCILMTGERISEGAEQRLDAVVRTQHGFELAELDLQMRGPGEFFGTRQAATPEFWVANLLRDRKMLKIAKQEAARFANPEPDGPESTEAERARVVTPERSPATPLWTGGSRLTREWTAACLSCAPNRSVTTLLCSCMRSCASPVRPRTNSVVYPHRFGSVSTSTLEAIMVSAIARFILGKNCSTNFRPDRFALQRAFSLVLSLLVVAPFVHGQQAHPVQQLTFRPYHSSGLYNVGDTVGWVVSPGPTALTYAYKWTIRRNNDTVLKEGKLDLSSGKDKIEIVADQPEMIYVAIEPYASLAADKTTQNQGAPPATNDKAAKYVGGNTGRNNGLYAVGAGVEPWKLKLSTPRPSDFDAFWNGKLAAQAKIPINPSLTPVKSDLPGVEESMFALDAMGSKVHGYIAKPARPGRFPAVILLQWAGVYALNPDWAVQLASDGWLVINVDAHDKLPTDPSANISKLYFEQSNTDREKSYFLNMYLRDSRALDYLLTRSDWDGKTIVLTGASQGGQQSFALAGLRPNKITAVLVCVPAGADTNGDLHGRKTGFPYWPSTDPKAMQTALYFDPVNFASRIHSPVMAGMGFIDTTSPPAGVWTALNQVEALTEPLPLLESEHNNLTPEKGIACLDRIQQILDSLRSGAAYHPTTLK